MEYDLAIHGRGNHGDTFIMGNTGDLMKKVIIIGKLFLLLNTARRDMEKWARGGNQKQREQVTNKDSQGGNRGKTGSK